MEAGRSWTPPPGQLLKSENPCPALPNFLPLTPVSVRSNAVLFLVEGNQSDKGVLKKLDAAW